MPAVTRKIDPDAGDKHSSDHDPRTVKSGQYSPNVFVNGENVVRVNDIWEDVHNPPYDEEQVTSASTTVTVNGKFVVRTGDIISGCGREVGGGSPNVFAG